MVGVGGVGDVLVRVAGCVACVAWVGMVVCLWGWHAGIGGISGALTWVAILLSFLLLLLKYYPEVQNVECLLLRQK